MLLSKLTGIRSVAMALLLPGVSVAEPPLDTRSIIQRLRSDPRIPLTLKAIQQGYYQAPDLNAAVKRCVTAASLTPNASPELETEACLHSMVGGLDPFSAYLSPDEIERLMNSPRVGAIGLNVRKSNRGAQVASVISGSPSAQAGIDEGSHIITINGESTAPMSLPEVIAALQGPIGSTVSLQIEPPGSSEVTQIKITREHIQQTSITSQTIYGTLGYVRIPQISGKLSVQLAETLRSLLITPSRPVEGIIMDLRDCPGGLLHGTIALAAIFLPEDAEVMAITSRREGERRYRARVSDASSNSFDPRPLLDDSSLRAAAQKIPLAILVNHETTSGAEAVVAALQEAGRAYVIGQATAGVSSVQTLLPLSNQDAIKFTTDVMHTASGRSWAGQGVLPDYRVPQTPQADRNTRLSEDAWLEAARNALQR